MHPETSNAHILSNEFEVEVKCLKAICVNAIDNDFIDEFQNHPNILPASFITLFLTFGNVKKPTIF